MWLGLVMVPRSPPDPGLTALIVFVTVVDPPTPRWLAYTHFSPTATGNRVEPADVVVEPLDEVELLDCVPPEPEPEPPAPPEPPDPPELPEPPPHPATSSAATARAPVIRRGK